MGTFGDFGFVDDSDLDFQTSFIDTRHLTEISFGDFIDAKAEEAKFFNPSEFLRRSRELDEAENEGVIFTLSPEGFLEATPDPNANVRFLTAEEFRHSEHFRPGLSFPTGVKESVARVMARQFDERQAFQDSLQRAPGGVISTVTGIGVDFAVGLTDPINLATAFIPVGSGVGSFAARQIARAGLSAGAQRVGAQLTGNFLAGAAGQAAIEPIMLSAAERQQVEYGFDDALLNIGFAGILGAGFGLAGQASRGAIEYGRNIARQRRATRNANIVDVLDEAAPGTHRANLETATAQILSGREVDVSPVLGNDPNIGGIVRDTPKRLSRLQLALADLQNGKIPTRRELQRLLSKEEFAAFKTRASEIVETSKNEFVPVRTKTARAFVRAAERAENTAREAQSPAQLKRAAKAQRQAEKLFDELTPTEKQAFIERDTGLPQRRRVALSKRQATAQAATEALEQAIEARLSRQRADAIQGAGPVQKRLLAEGRDPLTRSETIELAKRNQASARTKFPPAEPVPESRAVDENAALEKDVADLEAQMAVMRETQQGFSQKEVADELAELDAALNKLEGERDAMMAGLACIGRVNG